MVLIWSHWCKIEFKNKGILCLGKGLADGLDHTSIVNFTKQQKEFCLRFHFNGVNSYMFLNGFERQKLKAKILKYIHLYFVWVMFFSWSCKKDWIIRRSLWFLGWLSKCWCWWYFRFVDDIHKYLIVTNNIK